MGWPDLAAGPLSWVVHPAGRDRNGDVTQAVIFTRVLGYRNFAGFPFVVSAPPNACAAVADKALDLIAKRGGLEILRLGDLPPRAIRVLREREILPLRATAFPGKRGYKYAAIASAGEEWILVNEVEHATFGRIFPGAPAPADFAAAYPVPEEAPDRKPWAWSPAFGYLASDPARCGPGLSVECLVHLPGLALSRQLPQARNYLVAAGAGFRPIAAFTPNSAVSGDADAGLFRLSLPGRLGKNVSEVYREFLGTVEPVLRRENEARNLCLEKHHKRLEVRIQQSLRFLAGKGPMAYAGMLAAASFAKLGAGLGMASPKIAGILEELRIRAASGHLAVSSGRDLSQEEEDFSRANVVRSYLEAEGGEIH